jgi:hypothetical protein
LTFASSRFGVLNPYCTSKPSTPRNKRFCDGSDQGKRILAQGATGENDFDGGPGQFGGDVHGIGDDGEVLEIAQGAGNRRGRGARVENQDLAFFHLRCSAFCDAQFFLAVELFFLPQGWIFERTFAGGERAAVSAMDQAVGVQDLEILANRNL